MSGDQAPFDVVLSVLRSHPYGFLGTAAEGGHVSLRLVQHLAVDADGSVWIGTSPRSRKVAELRRHHTATYAVEDRAAFAYACATGEADVVDSLADRVRVWEEGLRAFFPAGPDGGDFVLIRLRPQRVELMSFAAGIHPEPYGLVPAVLTRAAGGWYVESRPQVRP